MPSEEFVASVVAGVAYWRERTRNMDDAAIAELDGERHNLFRAVQFGLGLPQAWLVTAEVALQTVPLVNRRMYWQEWAPVLESLVAQSPQQQQRLRFKLLIQLGRLRRMMRQLEEATAVHQQAKALAAELGEENAIAEAHYNLGRDFNDRRLFDDAERHSRQTLQILAGADEADQQLIAQAHNTLGNVYRSRGEYDKAGDHLAQAVAVWRTIDKPTELARAISDQASNWHYAGKTEEALSLFREAEQLLEPTANELDKALIRINLASAYFAQEAWSEAETALRQADSNYLRQSGNQRYQAILATNLGNVLLKQGRLTEAEAYLNKAIGLHYQVGDDITLANAIGTLGEVLAAQGESAEADEQLDKALDLLAKYPNHDLAKRLTRMFEEEKLKLTEDKA